MQRQFFLFLDIGILLARKLLEARFQGTVLILQFLIFHPYVVDLDNLLVNLRTKIKQESSNNLYFFIKVCLDFFSNQQP